MGKIKWVLSSPIRIHRRQGICTYCRGLLRRKYYARLKRKYGFGEWHITPYELRPYACEIIKFVTKLCADLRLSSICEVGCGLGDIIRNIKLTGRKVGLDISSTAIVSAKHLGGGGRVL